MTTQSRPEDDDPFAHLQNPYPWYDRIRNPPFYSHSYGAWIISHYHDILWVLERPNIFSSVDTMTTPQPIVPSARDILAEGYPPAPALLNSDGALHHRLRTIVESAFTPRLKGMQALLRAQANILVDSFHLDGHAELMGQFALPFAFEALCELLAIPPVIDPCFGVRVMRRLNCLPRWFHQLPCQRSANRCARAPLFGFSIFLAT